MCRAVGLANYNIKSMNNGWIKLHRKFLNWRWFSDQSTNKVFLTLLLLANHQPSCWLGKKIRSGQLITGRKSLKTLTSLSEQKIRTSLKKLQSTNEITIKSTNKFSLITIVNWRKYQIEEKNQPANQPANQPTSNQQLTTNKKIKNVKNIKNILRSEQARKIPNLLKDKQKHIQIIGLYGKAKQIIWNNSEQQRSFIKRNLRPARNLTGYNFKKIADTMKYLIDNADFKWTIETVGKFIDEDLDKLKKLTKSEDDIIQDILSK